MQRLIISLAVASVFSAMPTIGLAAPRLFESQDVSTEVVVQSGETSQEKNWLFDTKITKVFKHE